MNSSLENLVIPTQQNSQPISHPQQILMSPTSQMGRKVNKQQPQVAGSMLHMSEHSSSSGGTNSLSQHIVTNHHHNPIVTQTQPSSIQYGGLRDGTLQGIAASSRVEGVSFIPLGSPANAKQSPKYGGVSKSQKAGRNSQAQPKIVDKEKSQNVFAKIKEEDESVGIEEEKKEGAVGPHVQKPTPSQNRPALRLNLEAVKNAQKSKVDEASAHFTLGRQEDMHNIEENDLNEHNNAGNVGVDSERLFRVQNWRQAPSISNVTGEDVFYSARSQQMLRLQNNVQKQKPSQSNPNINQHLASIMYGLPVSGNDEASKIQVAPNVCININELHINQQISSQNQNLMPKRQETFGSLNNRFDDPQQLYQSGNILNQNTQQIQAMQRLLSPQNYHTHEIQSKQFQINNIKQIQESNLRNQNQKQELQSIGQTQGQSIKVQEYISPQNLQNQRINCMIGQGQIQSITNQFRQNQTGINIHQTELALGKNSSNQAKGSDVTRKQLLKQPMVSYRTHSVNQQNSQAMVLVQKNKITQRSPKAILGQNTQIFLTQTISRQQKKSMKSLRVQSSSKKNYRGNFKYQQEDEERVPNEHPSKANALGLRFYQTNYFSQSQDSQNQFQQIQQENHPQSERFSKTERLGQLRNPTKDSKEEEKSPMIQQNNIDSYGGGSFTAKKRQPTLMPYNLPGDDLEQFEKVENMQRQNKEFRNNINPFELNQFLQPYPTQNNYEFLLGESEFVESENFVSLDQKKFENDQFNINTKSKVITEGFLQSSGQKDSKNMSKSELISEVDILRKELKKRDLQIKKHAIEGQRLRRETQQLTMKLRLEVQSNSMLIKNMNRMRQNYFQNIHSPAQAPNNLSPKTNQVDNGIGFDKMFQSNQGLRDKKSKQDGEQFKVGTQSKPQQVIQRTSPMINVTKSELLRRSKQSSRNQMNQPLGIIENNPAVIEQPSSAQILQIKFQNITSEANQSQLIQYPSEPPSEQSSFIHQAPQLQELPPPPKIQAFQPPTRASQGAQRDLVPNQFRVSYYQGPQAYIQRGNASANQRRNPRQNLIINQRRTNQGARIPQNILDEDGSLVDTQYNDDSILVNRVNEMQIKTSRFDQPFLHFGHLGSHHQTFYRHEDFIPNEEPLINVREFWDNDLNHNHRMRWPIQGTFHGQRRMRVPNGGLQTFGFYDRNFRNHQPHAYIQIPVRNQQQVLTSGQRRLVAPQGNFTQGITAQRRGYINQNEAQGLRMRVASQGPPLRNINGDSHSLLEEEYFDQTHQLIGDVSQNISNVILSASGNPILGRPSQNQVMQTEDSIIDLEDEERHHALPMRNQQIFMQFNNNRGFGNFRPMGGPNAGAGPMNGLHAGGFSFDDGGMDEYDVADERVHLWEYINPDNMTYEEMIALQDRIGYVTKGLTLDQINSFPKMKRKEVVVYLKKMRGEDIKEEEKKSAPDNKLSSNEEQKKRTTKRFNAKYRKSAEDEIDEIIDGDEGIVNRRLPINQYNHQVQLDYSQRQSANIFQPPFVLPTAKFGQIKSNEDEDGIENCREEDEERIEADRKSLQPQAILEESKEHMAFEVESMVSADNTLQALHAQMNAEELQLEVNPAQHSHVISDSKESVTTMHNERCAVCFDTMLKNDYVKVLTCGHYYHIDCIDQWLLVEKRCPMCMMYLDGKEEKKQAAQ